jgi:hypothetical protein
LHIGPVIVVLEDLLIVHGDQGLITDHGSTVKIVATTIAHQKGQGLTNQGKMYLINSTLTQNGEGAILNASGGILHIIDSTIAENGSTAVTNQAKEPVEVRESILAMNGQNSNCFGLLESKGYNLVGNDCQGFSPSKHDLIDVDPKLGTLQFNGGQTPTMALIEGSPAIDIIPKEECVSPAFILSTATDQRGIFRPQWDSCDSGAFEFHAPFIFSGFLDLPNNPPALNPIKNTQSVGINFSLVTYQGMRVLAKGYPMSMPIDCTTKEPLGPLRNTLSEEAGGLSYSWEDDSYHYQWKLLDHWQGTCRQLTILLSDGTTHSVNFQFGN